MLLGHGPRAVPKRSSSDSAVPALKLDNSSRIGEDAGHSQGRGADLFGQETMQVADRRMGLRFEIVGRLRGTLLA